MSLSACHPGTSCPLLLAEVEASANVEESLRVLRAAVATKQVPPADVLQAMLKVEKAKVKVCPCMKRRLTAG